MKDLSPGLLAWLLPIGFSLHQLEEYFGGFLEWYPTILNATLSQEDFILINSIALFIAVLFAITYNLGIRSNFAFVVIGSLLFANGIVHTLLTLFTWTYSPGVLTGLVILLPLGFATYRKIYPELPQNQRIPSVALGMLLLFSVSIIARSMATI